MSNELASYAFACLPLSKLLALSCGATLTPKHIHPQTHIHFLDPLNNHIKPEKLPTHTTTTTTSTTAEMHRDPMKRIWVGNLDVDLRVEDIAAIFGQFGEIVWLEPRRNGLYLEADIR